MPVRFVFWRLTVPVKEIVQRCHCVDPLHIMLEATHDFGGDVVENFQHGGHKSTMPVCHERNFNPCRDIAFPPNFNLKTWGADIFTNSVPETGRDEAAENRIWNGSFNN